MLNLAQKIIDNISNKVSTLSFGEISHLALPVLNGERSSQSSNLPESLFLDQNQLSFSSNLYTESDIEQNLAKSRRSQESIEVKRSIIKKMNHKILQLEKNTKNTKLDIYQLEAYKNDLLLDFLEYEKSKRNHQQEVTQRQEKIKQQEKSFFFMKNSLEDTQTEQKTRNSLKFTNKPGHLINPTQQNINLTQLTPIQICVPIIRLVDIEIPILNFAQNKIRETVSTSPQYTKQGEDYFGNQMNSVHQNEIEQNLPLNSQRSDLFLNEARVMDLGTDRSEKSFDYRHNSDKFFTQEDDLIKNLQERDEICYNQKTQRKNYYNSRQSQQILEKSFDKNRIKSLDYSLKESLLQDELKLESEISEKQSSNYQQKRIIIQNQTKQFYKDKINELQSDLRQKAQLISEFLKKNQAFLKEVQKLNVQDERKKHAIQGANLKIIFLEEKVDQFQKYLKDVQDTAQQNSNKLMNEIQQLSNELQSKNEQLGFTLDSMQVVEKNAYKKQKNLLREIQNLQNTVHKMKQEIEYYKKRFQEEGIKLNFTEIELIEEAIEDRQKIYETNIQKLKVIYESELSQLKKKFSSLEGEAKQLQQKNIHLSLQSQIQSKMIPDTAHISTKQDQARKIIDIYDSELEKRDQQVITIKRQLTHCQMALLQALQLIQDPQKQTHSASIQCGDQEANSFRNPHDQLVISKLIEKNQSLQGKLALQTTNRLQMNQKLLKLQKLIQFDSCSDSHTASKTINPTKQQSEYSHEYKLIQGLTNELQSLMGQLKKQKQTNKKLRQQLNSQKPCSPISESKQVTFLKQKLKKLTKYSQLLEKQIKQIYKVGECQAHSKIISRLQNELKSTYNEKIYRKAESIIIMDK